MRQKTLALLLALALPLGLAAAEKAKTDPQKPREGRAAWSAEGRGPGAGADRMPDRMLERLDLSQAQKDQLKALRQSQREQSQNTQKELQAARTSLRELLAQADRSSGASTRLKAQHAKVQKLEQAQADHRFEAMLKIRGILTDEQLQKFVAFQKGGPRQGGREERGKGEKRGDKRPARDKP